MNDKIQLVENDLREEDLDLFLSQDLIAVDCEMMGLNVHRDRLCLVQIGDADRNIRLVKIALGQTEAPRLKCLMEDDTVRKLFHYARTDVAWLKFWLSTTVTNFFCTKIGSKLARTYTDKHSLKEVTKEILGKDISKAQQSSDWGAATLTKNQMNYAANDVYNLIEIYKALKLMLERESRMDLAERTVHCVSVMADLDNFGYESVLEH
ncbi:MAG: ribonuclease D [Candidatus Caenarcaniphilales bacterium]|nr:ribonuclease D [Candidatus Caenarcaniphilales bacterium]